MKTGKEPLSINMHTTTVTELADAVEYRFTCATALKRATTKTNQVGLTMNDSLKDIKLYLFCILVIQIASVIGMVYLIGKVC